jgi:DNA primase
MNEVKPDIMAVMGREVNSLHKAGRTYRGKCPNHDGKSNGSLTVYPDSQSWFCWGCGEGGDVVDFIMKLHDLSFKDACKYLNIIPGKPAPIDPAITRQKKIQKDYETAINNLWEKLCERSRELYRIKLQVKNNPGALTEQGAALFAGLMGKLAEVDYQIDTLLKGNFEDKVFLLRGEKYAYRGKIGSAAA